MTTPEPAPEERHAIRGKRLLLVLGSYRSKRHVYEHARDLGVSLVVIDGPDHWASEAGAPFERHLPVALEPFATFVDRAVMAARASGLEFDGIGTIDEFAGGFAARIADRLALPFHSVEAADIARDKHRAREAAGAAGIPGPRVARIEGEGDVERAAATVGFPAVLKPVSGVGSVQAFRVESDVELRARVRAVFGEAAGARAASRAGLGSDRDWFDLMWSGRPALILESWIEGPKFDVDLLLEEGAVAYGRVTDDLEPFGLRDVRRVAPSNLSAEDETALIAHAAACVRAIGFRRGAFNIEVKRTIDGPRTIEVNGRLGGYSTTDVHRAVWGVDLIEQWLRLSFRLPATAKPHPPAMFVAESLLPSPISGCLLADGFLAPVAGETQVVACRPWVFAGDTVAGVETGAPDWLGALLTRGETREGALRELDRLSAIIEPRIQPR